VNVILGHEFYEGYNVKAEASFTDNYKENVLVILN